MTTRLRLFAVLALVVLAAGSPVAHSAATSPAVASSVETTLRPEVPVSQVALSKAVAIMRERLTRLGFRGGVSQQGQAIVIRLDTASTSKARTETETIDESAQLDFYDLTPALLPPSIGSNHNATPSTSLYNLLTRATANRSRHSSEYYLFDPTTKKPLAGPSSSAQKLRREATLTDRRAIVLTVPGHATIVTCSAATAIACPGLTAAPNPAVTYYYLIKHGAYPNDRESPYPQLDSNDIKLTGAHQAIDPATGIPIVTIQFTPKGDRLFHMITRAEAERGQALSSMQSFAIVLDGRLYSFPTIDYTAYPNGIDPTTGAEITGLATTKAAKQLVTILQTGQLATTFTIANQRIVH